MFDILKGAIGIIHSVNDEKYTAKVKLLEHDDYITENLPILTPIAFSNKINCLPHIGTPVIVILIGDNKFILSSWNSKARPGNFSKGKLVIDYQKSVLELDEVGTVTLRTNELNIEAETTIKGSLTVENNVQIKNNLNVSNNIEGGKEIKAAGIAYAKDFIKG